MAFPGFEVECTDTYAFYTAEVIDSAKKKKNQNDRLLINWVGPAGPGTWKPQEWVDVARVRAAPRVPKNWRPRVGEKLEVLNRAAEDEPDGWWPAKVKGIAGQQYVIGYYGWEDDQYDSHVDLQDLRPTNTNPRLKGVDVAKYKRDAPQESGKKDRDERARRDFKRALSILDEKRVDVAQVVRECQAYTYIDVSERAFKDRQPGQRGRAYLVIGTKKSAKKAVTILKLDIEHAVKSEVIGEQNDRLQGIQKKREEREAKYLAMAHDQFLVPEKVVRYVIGLKGSNIAAAREIVEGNPRFEEADQGKIALETKPKGSQISNDDYATVDIYAATRERVEAARELLDVQMLEKRIPSAYLGSIIGERGSKINEIKQTSEVFAIDIPQRPSKDSGPRDQLIDITIIGKPSSIAMCESLIDRTVSHEDDLANLRKQTNESRKILDTWDQRSNVLDDLDDSLADMSLAERSSTGSPLPEETPRDISPSPSPEPVAASETTTSETTTKKKKKRRRKGRKA